MTTLSVQHVNEVPLSLLERYAKPLPRYTSYPPAPAWAELDAQAVDALLAPSLARDAPLSLYVHLPFCKSLCRYCGCNMLVSNNRQLMDHYVTVLIQELEAMAPRVAHRKVMQLHLGGGTPTHLDPGQLGRLGCAIHRVFNMDPTAEQSIEVHPPVTTLEHVEVLEALGFSRMSMGVQDFNPAVQEAVNRHQPAEQTLALAAMCREHGFTSINVDLMYGLPHQSVDTLLETVAILDRMKPDRLALFGYAHVPWMKPHQKLLNVDDMPGPAGRMAMFLAGIRALTSRGYRHVGLDHFSLPGDALALALQDHALRRNFMGYTTLPETDVLAFGASGISETGGAFFQNEPDVHAYMQRMDDKVSPVVKGLSLTAEDRLRRDIIQELFCNLRVDLGGVGARHGVDGASRFTSELEALRPLQDDGLLSVDGHTITVLPTGQLMLRNVAAVFDAYLAPAAGGAHRHSTSI